MTDTNPCIADKDRRQRATAGDTLISRDGPMERHITFTVGYDHSAHPDACGGGGHGRHGMTLTFILKGPSGATQFSVNMPNWFPGNISIIGNVPNTGSPSLVQEVPARWPAVDDAMAWDLGYHSPRPQYDDQTERNDCHLLDGGACYYDGSGLEAFLSHGPMAVWAALARYYAELFDDRHQDEEHAH